MENYRPPIESAHSSDEEAAVEGGKKKKKKTTRIPKSAGILPKVEADEAKTSKKEDKPENVLEKVFAKEIEKSDQEDKTDDSDVIPSENAEEITEGEEVIPDQSFEVLEEEPQDLPETLEGEFTDEGTIIARAEAPNTETKAETVSDAPRAEKPAAELVDSPGDGFEPPEPRIDTPSSAEVPQEEPTLVEEAVSHEETTLRPPIEYPMFDPNTRQNQETVVRQERTEASEPSITRSEHEREIHYARKRANSRGVVTGGTFGYWLGRRGRRAAEKEAASAHETVKKQDEKIERLEAEQALATERLRAIQNTEVELANHARSTEVPKVAPMAEKSPTSTEKVLEKQADITEQFPEQMPEEKYHTPEAHRVETSAWHRYEVDKKTGQVVENPELSYGEAFVKEQRQERLQRPAAEPQVAVQLGQAVVQNATLNSSSSTAVEAKAEPKPTKSKKAGFLKDKTYIKQQLIQRTTSPVTWIAALLLVVLLFVIGIL